MGDRASLLDCRYFKHFWNIYRTAKSSSPDGEVSGADGHFMTSIDVVSHHVLVDVPATVDLHANQANPEKSGLSTQDFFSTMQEEMANLPKNINQSFSEVDHFPIFFNTTFLFNPFTQYRQCALTLF